MEFKKTRKFKASALIMVMLAGTFLTGFTYQQGIGNVYYETESEIYTNTTYHKQLGGNSSNGIQRAYFVKADTQNTDLKPYVFEGEVTGNYTMSTMVNTLENQGYNVVAGINGDVYDTATGTPKGLVIHDGKILTSGYAPEYVISFDEFGAASLQWVELEYTLKGMINVPTTVPVPQPEQPIIPEASASPENQNGTNTVDSAEQIIDVPTEYTRGIGYFNVCRDNQDQFDLC